MLFVNAAGALKISLLDPVTLAPLPGLAEADCLLGSGGGDRHAVRWKGGDAVVERLAGRPFRLSVSFAEPAARLFSIWIAKDLCGASGGGPAAGGRGHNATRDLYGRC